MTNADFAVADSAFKEACKLASTGPTRRQASKYRRSMGAAWRARAAFMSRYLFTRTRLEEELKRAEQSSEDAHDILVAAKTQVDLMEGTGEVDDDVVEHYDFCLEGYKRAKEVERNASLNLARHEQVRLLLKGESA